MCIRDSHDRVNYTRRFVSHGTYQLYLSKCSCKDKTMLVSGGILLDFVDFVSGSLESSTVDEPCLTTESRYMIRRSV